MRRIPLLRETLAVVAAAAIGAALVRAAMSGEGDRPGRTGSLRPAEAPPRVQASTLPIFVRLALERSPGAGWRPASMPVGPALDAVEVATSPPAPVMPVAPAPRGTAFAPDLAVPVAPSRFGAAPDEIATRPRPGSFTYEPNEVPSPFLKTKLIAPRLSPDIELPLSPRATLGLFGEVGRVDPRSTAPPLLNRDIGAGVTLQYRFGGN